MLTTNQIEALAQTLILHYDFPALLAQFSWGDEGMPAAWHTRGNLVPAARISDDEAAADFAQDVHRWGFGGKRIRSEIVDTATWLPAIGSLVREWQITEDPLDRADALRAFRDILGIKLLGMATVTKWTCFLDQERFAIYDSRVSYALRILTIDNLRVFPIVGGRVQERDRPIKISADPCVMNAATAVTIYSNFLRTVRRTSSLLNAQTDDIHWNAARVECCLFVAGESRLREQGIAPLNNRINVGWDAPR